MVVPIAKGSWTKGSSHMQNGSLVVSIAITFKFIFIYTYIIAQTQVGEGGVKEHIYVLTRAITLVDNLRIYQSGDVFLRYEIP